MNGRLYRSRDERILAGVAGGLAEQFNVDPSLVRIVWLVLAIATAGVAVFFYVVMAFIVPSEPAGDDRWSAWQDRAGAGPPSKPGASTADGPSGPAAAAGSPGPPPDSMSSGAGQAGATARGGAATTAGAGQPASADPAWRAGSPWATRSDAKDARRQARAPGNGSRSDGFGAVLIGLILVLAGGYLLVRAYIPSIDVDTLWPILVVIIGVLLLLGSVRRSPGPSS